MFVSCNEGASTTLNYSHTWPALHSDEGTYCLRRYEAAGECDAILPGASYEYDYQSLGCAHIETRQRWVRCFRIEVSAS